MIAFFSVTFLNFLCIMTEVISIESQIVTTSDLGDVHAYIGPLNFSSPVPTPPPHTLPIIEGPGFLRARGGAFKGRFWGGGVTVSTPLIF